jgi:hypothetical protein
LQAAAVSAASAHARCQVCLCYVSGGFAYRCSCSPHGDAELHFRDTDADIAKRLAGVIANSPHATVLARHTMCATCSMDRARNHALIGKLDARCLFSSSDAPAPPSRAGLPLAPYARALRGVVFGPPGDRRFVPHRPPAAGRLAPALTRRARA